MKHPSPKGRVRPKGGGGVKRHSPRSPPPDRAFRATTLPRKRGEGIQSECVAGLFQIATLSAPFSARISRASSGVAA
jgi:hypothetical protein